MNLTKYLLLLLLFQVQLKLNECQEVLHAHESKLKSPPKLTSCASISEIAAGNAWFSGFKAANFWR